MKNLTIFGYGLILSLIFLFLPWPTPPAHLQVQTLWGKNSASFQTLPQSCRPKPLACQRHYQLELGILAADTVLYLSHFNGDVQILLDGQVLYDSQSYRPALLNHNQTLYLPLPSGEPAQLAIILSTWGLLPIHLGPVAIGEAALLKPYYQWQHLFFDTLPRLFLAFNLLFSLIFFWVFLYRRHEKHYLFFALFLWVDFLSYLPLWLDQWSYSIESIRFLHLLFTLKAVLLLYFSLYFRKFSPPKYLFFIWLVPLIAYLALWLLPTLAFAWLAKILLMPISLLMGLSAIWLLIGYDNNDNKPLFQLIKFLFLLTFLLAVREGLMVYQLLSDNGMFLSRFSLMVGVAAVALFLMHQLIQALKRSDDFNQELQEKIQAAEIALKVSFSREQAIHKAMLLAQERERLTYDLHDGLAGQLLSILLQSENPNSDKKQIAQAARAALSDLRLVIDSLEDVGDDLATMLATFHERLQAQLRGQRLQLQWQMADLPPLPGLQPSVTLEIFRILQEAVNNVLRHAEARHLTITAALENGHIVITVQDDGCGGIAMRPHGYGLQTMQKRAERIGASLLWGSDKSGSWLKLALPPSIPMPLL